MRRTIPTAFGVLAFLAASLAARGQTIAPVEGSQAMVGARGIQVPPVARTEVVQHDRRRDDRGRGLHAPHRQPGGRAEERRRARGRCIVAVLIPDIPPFDLAYKTLGLLPASLEMAAAASPHGGLYCMAKQQTLEVGFPRYRVLLYNTSGSAATVAFFAYRSRR